MLRAVNGEASPSTPDQSTTIPTGESPRVLVLSEVGKPGKQWTLELHPAHLGLVEVPGTPPYVIMREEVMKGAMLIEGMNVFALTKPTKASFKLAPEATAALADWIGKPALMIFYLRRRSAWVLPVAVIWLLGSLPISGNPASGTKPVPFDLIGFTLALILIGSWALAKWRPHPVLFLVDSFWFLLLSVRLLIDVFVEGRSKGWLVFVVFAGWLVVNGVKHYRRFRGTRITAA
jgi:hypothetical protein